MAAAGGDGEPPGHNYDPYHKEGPDPAEDFDDLKPEKRARLIAIPKRTAPLEKNTAASVKKDLKKKNEGTLSSGDASSSTSNPNKREHLTSSSSTDSGPDAKISRRASNSDSDIEGRERMMLAGFNPQDTPLENRVKDSGSIGMGAMIPIKEYENEMEGNEDNGDNDEVGENTEEVEVDENNEEDEVDENNEDDDTSKRQDPDVSPGGSDADDRLVSS